MEVQVLFFASARDQAGVAEATLQLADGARLRDLVDEVVRRFPQLRASVPSLRLAVNEDFAAKEAPLKNGDRVAMLPPVSGG